MFTDIISHDGASRQVTTEKIAELDQLGNIVKFVSAPDSIRKNRYKLQEKMQSLLKAHTAFDEFKGLKTCMKVQISDVAIHHSVEHNKAFYGNLATCSSVWACPVCSAKIQSRRAQEINKGMFRMYHAGYTASMITFTHPHNRTMGLASNIDMHNNALRKLRAGRQWVKFKDRTGYKGLIRGSEVTHGLNGWHYHTHEIWFVAGGYDMSKEREWLANRWYECCIKAGFNIPDKSAFLANAVDIQVDVHSSQYLAKFGRTWGIDKEVSMGASKKGHGKTPFELLDSDDSRDNELFIEYVRATRGKAQLFWSRGLKAMCGIQLKTDEELNAEQDDTAEVIAFLTRDLWNCVKYNHARAELLDIAEVYGFDGIQEWFKQYGYAIQPPKKNGMIA